jgi:hypothetical protein
MDITVAYFHPFFHPESVKHDFEQIRALGATSLVCAIHEQEEQRLSRDLERGLRMAQDTGLKVHLSLGRYGNLFAGPVLMPSWYTFHHPQSRVQDRHGSFHSMSCFNHESFRSWLFAEIEHYLTIYPINGIVLDEPRGPDVTCYCSVCRALCPDVMDLEHFRRRSMVEFLGELFSCVKRVSSSLKTTIVLLPQDLDLLDDLVSIPNLDTIGCHLFWQLLHEDISMVETWGNRVVQVARRYQKRSQLWLQNYNLDEAGENLLEDSFAQIQAADPDDIACYYYWRNNLDPERVWLETNNLFRRLPRRQLHWKTTASQIPIPPLPKLDRTPPL